MASDEVNTDSTDEYRATYEESSEGSASDEETDIVNDESSDTNFDTKEDEEESSTPSKDDELEAIKLQISNLELELKNKRRTLAYYNDMADDYTKSGYARKVAEMENMRRARSMLASSNKFTATAQTLKEFVPSLEMLEQLSETYANDSFGKQYNAVAGAMKTGFKNLGVTEFDVNVGDIVDVSRMDVVNWIHSSEFPKDNVIEVLSVGLELNGNLVRPAKCIASLGPEVNDDNIELSSESTDDETESNENNNDNN